MTPSLSSNPLLLQKNNKKDDNIDIPEEFYADLDKIRSYDERLYHDLISALSDPNPDSSKLQYLLLEMNNTLKYVSNQTIVRDVNTSGRQQPQQSEPQTSLVSSPLKDAKSSVTPPTKVSFHLLSKLFFIVSLAVTAVTLLLSRFDTVFESTHLQSVYGIFFKSESPLQSINFDVTSISGPGSAWNTFTNYTEVVSKRSKGISSFLSFQSLNANDAESGLGLGKIIAAYETFSAPSLFHVIYSGDQSINNDDTTVKQLEDLVANISKNGNREDVLVEIDRILSTQLNIPVKVSFNTKDSSLSFQVIPGHKLSQNICSVIWDLGALRN